MQDFWLKMKDILLLSLTALFGVVSDFQHAFIALFVGFIFNFIMGMGADANIERKEKKDTFSMKKATEGFKLFMFYIITIFCIFGMTYRDIEIANSVIKWLTYIVSYFYITNIFRNAKKIFPNNKSIAFLYLFLSTEVFYKIKKMLGFRE